MAALAGVVVGIITALLLLVLAIHLLLHRPKATTEVLEDLTQQVVVVVLIKQEKRVTQMAHNMVVTVEMEKLPLFLEFLQLTLEEAVA
jgi:hypothetical protein